MSLTLRRTAHPKYTTYWGDGNGKDHYITFNNGSLHGLRDYRGSQQNGFSLSHHLPSQNVTPKREPTAVKYIEDGTGRDSYIIRY